MSKNPELTYLISQTAVSQEPQSAGGLWGDWVFKPAKKSKPDAACNESPQYLSAASRGN